MTIHAFHERKFPKEYALKQYDKAMRHFAALRAKEDLDAEINRERIKHLQVRTTV